MSEFLLEASARIITKLEENGIAHAVAVRIAGEWEAEIARDYGGDRPYIGRRSGPPMEQRDAAIRRARAAGESVPAIARRLKLSRVRVWQILREG